MKFESILDMNKRTNVCFHSTMSRKLLHNWLLSEEIANGQASLTGSSVDTSTVPSSNQWEALQIFKHNLNIKVVTLLLSLHND